MAELDGTDRRILHHLQTNARITNAELARRIGLAPSAVYERVRKLERSGVILGYETRVDPRALGYGILAYVFVRAHAGEPGDRCTTRLGEVPGVQEVHHIAGEDCFLVKLRTRDTAELGHLLDHVFKRIGGVESTRTTIVLAAEKETTTLPIEVPEVEAIVARP